MLERWLHRRPRRRTLLLLLLVLVLYLLFIFFRSTQDLFQEVPTRVLNVIRPPVVHDPEPPPQNDTTKRELLLVQMVFRHGHRAPFNLYPNDPHEVSFWKEGMGQLTQLGRLQHYVMGDHLLKRYEDFITRNPEELELLTADSGRCQYGAYTFVAGLYPPTLEQAFTQELRWQPIISRHYPEKSNRWVLSRRKCAVAGEEEREYKASREADEMRAKFKPLYDFWSEHSGRNIKDWTRAADLGKTLACERDYNLSIPEWGLRYWDELELQAGLSYYWNYRTRLLQRYRTGPLLGYMLSKMREKVSGSLTDKKVLVFSSHGSNLSCLLLALGQFNFKAPPHASTLVVELWEEEGFGPVVRWLYFNSSSPERNVDPPVVLHPDGCGGRDFCSLDLFEEVTRDLIPGDVIRECLDFSQRKRFPPPTFRFVSSSRRNEFSLIMLCIILLLICVFK